MTHVEGPEFSLAKNADTSTNIHDLTVAVKDNQKFFGGTLMGASFHSTICVLKFWHFAR
jgi:hypothetical protein